MGLGQRGRAKHTPALLEGLVMHDVTHHHHEHDDREKFIKRIEHWVRHNEEHLRGYEEWKDWCERNGLTGIAEILGDVCTRVKEQNALLGKALDILKQGHR